MAKYLAVGENAKPNIPTVDEIKDLTEAIGWGRRESVVWYRALKASAYVAYARNEGNDLVGFGRVLEDGVMCMFYDIGVRPDHQGQGIGSLIVNELISQVRDVGYVSIGLFVWEENPTAAQFYEKFGFEPVGTGMELKRYMQPE
jgi:GNAT superfamily N-acetyltransferase